VTGIGNVLGLMSAECYQRIGFTGTAVEYGDIVSGLQQISRHRRAHVPQSDESNFHI
jgi:hypothetical protein